jgi:beta-glucosidase
VAVSPVFSKRDKKDGNGGFEMKLNTRALAAALGCGLLITLTVALRAVSSPAVSAGPEQPKIETRVAPLLKIGGLIFKDLNRNGVLDPYEDWRLPVDRRVADLVSQMTMEEKTGLMFHASIQGATGPRGEVLETMRTFGGGGARNAPQPVGIARAIRGLTNPYNVEPIDAAPVRDLILKRGIRWAVIRPGGETPEVTARFINNLQEIAEGSRLGIPMAPSDNPRNGVRRSFMGVEMAGQVSTPNGAHAISQWPGQLGLAATGDVAVVREYATIAAQEMRAMGLRVLLCPQADVATEPRWARIGGTFGEDADLVAKLVTAYVEGFQGKKLGPDSVLTVTKHFPGDGPVMEGNDPHNSYGKWTIYPANQFDYHLIPWKAAIQAGTGAVMGGYMIPVGKDTVGANFSKAIATDLLRGQLHFQGVMITDTLRSMPWGVENLSEKERQRTMVLAGVDQILSQNDPKYVIECVREGSIPAARLDVSARRILTAMFELGLFENPYVDPEKTKQVVGNDRFVAAGRQAQVRSVVLLKNANNVLPVAPQKRIYVANIDKAVAARYGTVVDDPRQADVALIRITTPAIVYPFGGGFGFGGRGRGPGRGALGPNPGAAAPSRGRSASAAITVPTVLGNTLAYTGSANQTQLDEVLKLAASGTPTVVCVDMDRPTILTEFIDQVSGVFATFGIGDDAFLDVVFGKHAPSGKLPFDLPSDMPSVEAQAADAAHDLDDPMFKFGFGLTYGK